MQEKITVMAWGQDEQFLGYDICFPGNGPILTLDVKQAKELSEGLLRALGASELPAEAWSSDI